MDPVSIGAVVGSAVVTGIGGCVGAYLGAYWKKRGEQAAAHQDLQNVVNEVRAVTKTTEEIKAEISTGIWDKQKRWEMKRDVSFEASKALAGIEEQLMGMHSVVAIARKHAEGPEWVAAWHEQLVEWRKALVTFEGVFSLATVIYAQETIAVFLKFRSLVGTISAGLSKKDEDAYAQNSEDLTRRAFDVRIAIRNELGVEPRAGGPPLTSPWIAPADNRVDSK